MARTPWGKIVLICGAGLPAAIALGKVALIAPLIQPDLGLSLPQLGWAVSAITAVAVLLGTLAGLWTRRYGARRTLLAGLAVLALAGAAGAAASGFGLLLAARLVEGVGYLLVVVAAPDLLVRLTHETGRAAALALWVTVIPVGLAIGGLLGGPLAEQVGWRGWLALTAVLPVVAAALVALAIPADRAEPAAPSTGQRPRLAGFGAPALLATGFCGLCLIGIAVISLLPTFLVGQRGASLGVAGAATAVASIASVPGSLLAGWLLRRGVGLRLLGAAALLMPLAALPAFAADTALEVAVAAAAAILLANGVAVAGTFAAAPGLVADVSQVPLAIGLMTQFGSLGTLLGAPLFSSVVAVMGWSAVAPLILAMTVLVVASLLAATARRAAPGTA